DSLVAVTSGDALTSAATRANVEALFSTRLLYPMKMLVDTTVYINSSGTRKYAMGDQIAMLKVAKGDLDDGFVRTPAKSRQKALGEIHQYEVANPGGRGLFVKSVFGVHVVKAGGSTDSYLGAILTDVNS
ncbi:MAG: hypothetical protein KDA28_00090, partial [Phycisphaerales bacterium]|nr:hypothetical protein [Phycisphaerales bacterium]